MTLSSPQFALDQTEEVRTLRRILTSLETQLFGFTRTIEKMEQEIAIFEEAYAKEISPLTHILEALERAIFKYQSISEHVGSHVTFEEAEQIFEDTLRDREEEMGRDYARAKMEMPQHDPIIELSSKEKRELKLLYRKLARIYHPDMPFGNSLIMTRINRAYAMGDLITLREIDEMLIDNQVVPDSREGLKREIQRMREALENAKQKIYHLRKSQPYKLRKQLLKNHETLTKGLDVMVVALRKEISIKKNVVEKMKSRIEEPRT